MKIRSNYNNCSKKILFYNFQFAPSIVLLPIMFLVISIIVIVNSIEISFAQTIPDLTPLKANAGEDQYVEEGKPVILNAEDSLSSDPPIDSYNWFQIEPRSPQIDIDNSNTSRASFTSPNLPSDQYFVFQLIVQDGEYQDTDTVNVYVLEDLNSLAKLQSGEVTYQPEQCFDGGDNDLDGKVDLQDEECGMTFMQNKNQLPLQGELRGQLPGDPLLQDDQTIDIPIDPYLQDEQTGQLLPGQGIPEQGQAQMPSGPSFGQGSGPAGGQPAPGLGGQPAPGLGGQPAPGPGP